jgi:hypothetical protein
MLSSLGFTRVTSSPLKNSQLGYETMYRACHRTIELIWHQMPALLATAAVFFTIGLLGFRKPSFKRRDGLL